MAFLTSPKLQLLPKRIISLVPSLTELLFDLDLDAEVVGITKFCIHPKLWFQSKTRIGGTKTIDLHQAEKLSPDLIIANKEENTKEQIEHLSQLFPVCLTDINNLDDALQMITDIGQLTNRNEIAQRLRADISNEFEQIAQKPPISAAYLIWKDPYMAAGSHTFINDMLQKAGLCNAFDSEDRYPQINLGELTEKNCQVVLLSSEPYPFKEKHQDEIRKEYPHLNSFLVDGEMFSWYGSRLLKAPAYFKKLYDEVNEKIHQ